MLRSVAKSTRSHQLKQSLPQVSASARLSTDGKLLVVRRGGIDEHKLAALGARLGPFAWRVLPRRLDGLLPDSGDLSDGRRSQTGLGILKRGVDEHTGPVSGEQQA